LTQKIKIAFIKYAGLTTGGTEKFLQTIAAGLPKEEFEVDYYYAHPEENPPDEGRKKYLIDSGVNVIEFKTSKPRVHRGKIWLDETDFLKVFKGANIIQTGRCGLFEEPFSNIKNIPIIDSMHYVVGVDNQYNISRVMHISEFSKRKWIESGGDESRIVMVSHPMIIPNVNISDFRKEYSLENKFIFGFHQRNDDAIFSPIPLLAYKEVETEGNAFVLLGGGERYKQQVKELNIKNIVFLEHTSNPDIIHSFLNMIDVYAHGRRDGELNSTAIAEALYYGKPVVSHVSDEFNGHIECIDNAGFVLNNCAEYAQKLKEIQQNKEFYAKLSQNAKNQFKKLYDYDVQMANIINIYKKVCQNPYPNKLKRIILDIKQKYKTKRCSRYK
jgi:glycosyltransferase involved in cell wall biosynthesis